MHEGLSNKSLRCLCWMCGFSSVALIKQLKEDPLEDPFQLVLSIGVKHLGIQSYAQTFQATRLFKCKGSNGNHMPYLYLDAIGTTMDRKVYRSIIFSVLYLFVHFDWMSFCVYVPVYGTKQLRRDPHSGCQEVLCLTYSYTYTSTSRLHLVEM